jgi:hypothetical protein
VVDFFCSTKVLNFKINPYLLLSLQFRMMVGAPKANDSNYETNRTNDVGLVYKCMFKGPCKTLKVDYKGISLNLYICSLNLSL